MSIQFLPRLQAVPGDNRDRPDSGAAPQRVLGGLHALLPVPRPVSERHRADVSGGHSAEVRRELPLGVSDRGPRVAEVTIGFDSRNGQSREPMQHQFGDVILEQPQRDRRRRRATTGTRPSVADVRRAAIGPVHHMPARLAPGDPGEQRRPKLTVARPGRPRDRYLGSLELVEGDERRVSLEVDVRPDVQFAEVHAVREQAANTAGSHREQVREVNHARARRAAPERLTDNAGAVAGNQAPGLGVAPVSGRGLTALPYPGGGREAPALCEPIDVQLTLVLRDPEQHQPLQPAMRRGGVDALLHDNDPPSSGLHAIPRFQDLASVAPEPREVRDDDPRVLAHLDALYGPQQRRPFLQRQAARDVELGGHQLEPRAAHGGDVALDRVDLFLVGVEAVSAALADETDTYDSRPNRRHAWDNRPNASAGARERVSTIQLKRPRSVSAPGATANGRWFPMTPAAYTEDQQRAYQRGYVAGQRKQFLAGKSCVDCGATENLEIDHVRGEKESHRIWSWSDERRLAELAKCDVRCRSCHGERHYAQMRQEHGLGAYKRGCRCDICKATKARSAREYSERKRDA